MAAESPTNSKPMTLALAAVGVLAAWAVLLPESMRPWNFAAIGAVGLFAFSRLPFSRALAVLALALAVKDICIYAKYGWPPEPLSWVAFAGYALIGHRFLRNTESPGRIGLAAVAGSLIFFVVSNFGSWLNQSLPYGYSLAGLGDCYLAAIPFLRGTLVSDLLATGMLFGLHAALSRSLFPAERVSASAIPVVHTEEAW